MDDRRVGRIVREVRVRKGWRQDDLARASGVSRSVISDIESGRLDRVSLPTLRAVGTTLDIRISIDAWWRAGEVDRLLDRGHAALVEYTLGLLRDHDWTTRVEVSFNDFGDRGSADVVGWHAAAAELLIGEIKTQIGDVQALHGTFGKKVRVLPGILERTEGWRARSVSRVLVVADSHANRAAVAAHRTTFDATWPGRTVAARRAIADPASHPGAAGILFVPPQRLPGPARARLVARVRRPVSQG